MIIPLVLFKLLAQHALLIVCKTKYNLNLKYVSDMDIYQIDTNNSETNFIISPNFKFSVLDFIVLNILRIFSFIKIVYQIY